METIYLSHDNTIELLLKSNGTPQDLSSVNRVQLEFPSVTLDSNTHPEYFNWNTGTTGKLVISAGSASLSSGAYEAKLIVYDPSHTNGVVWGKLEIVIE